MASGDDASWTGWGEEEAAPPVKHGLKPKAAAAKGAGESAAGFAGFPTDKAGFDDWLDDDWEGEKSKK